MINKKDSMFILDSKEKYKNESLTELIENIGKEIEKLYFDEQVNTVDDIICKKISNQVFRQLVKEYFKHNFTNEDVAKLCFLHVAKYDDILNQFILHLIHKNYDYSTNFNVEGYTAKNIYELSPSLKPTGVFSLMTSLRDHPELARAFEEEEFFEYDEVF